MGRRQWTSAPVTSSALPGATKAHAEVLAIVSWDKERSEPEYRKGLIGVKVVAWQETSWAAR